MFGIVYDAKFDDDNKIDAIKTLIIMLDIFYACNILGQMNYNENSLN